MKSYLKLFAAVCVLTLGGIGGGASLVSALEAETYWATEDMARTRLIASTTRTQDADEVTLAVQIQLDKGWKTYWRSPGDSGLPPRFDWKGSTNVASVEILWPTPKAVTSGGLLTWGYDGEVIFPIIVRLKNPAEDVQVNLEFNYGVCEKICIPLRNEFSLSIPAGKGQLSAHADLIETYKALVPTSLDQQTHLADLRVEMIDAKRFSLEVKSDIAFANPRLILEGVNGDYFNVGPAEISADEKRVTFVATADLVQQNEKLQGKSIFVTLLDGNISVEAPIVIK
jgi:DsbC/DsbD-like thiol-disulfide interchange protein